MLEPIPWKNKIGRNDYHSRFNDKISSLLWGFRALVLICLCLSVPVTSVREASELQNSREDVFSSIAKLEEVVENEMQVLDLLTTFTDYVIEKANFIKG